ncbi:MAG TPA: amidohydrolase family protein [Steroidobacteraceae bacterium]|nr:amidohydrolase family protein [Steroidobacteraceae bacterium]
MKIRSLLLAAAAALLMPALAGAERLIIDHVTVIEGTGRAPQRDMSVIIDGAQIAAVTPSQLAGNEAGRRIDARGKYLIPGLMDVHIHLRGAAKASGPGTKWEESSRAEALSALASYLYSGVTTIFDAGNRKELILPLRADERAGRILAPRIFATGNAITYPGSHGDSISIHVTDFEKDKALLDQHIAEQQPDMVKLMIEEEGWGSRPMITLLTADLAEKIVRYYNQHGIRTTAHVSNEFRSLEAIYAGLDTLAHPIIQGPVSDSFVKLMAVKKTPFASTLTIGENYSRLAEHPEYLDQPLYAASLSTQERDRLKTQTAAEYRARTWTTWMKVMTPIAQENIRKIHAAGGVVACGTDQSSGPAVHRELELLAAAGIAPLDVIRIATYNSAVFLGKADRIGSVQAGRLADLVLLNADPAASIDNAKQIAFVMKNGEIVDESKLPLAGGKQQARFTAAR